MVDAVPRAIAPEDLCRFALVGDPQLSPDGARLAYVLTTIDGEKNENRSAIWVMPASGGPARRFTAAPKRDHAPRWSPGGPRLASVPDRGDKPCAPGVA